jgi:hypothetical protein
METWAVHGSWKYNRIDNVSDVGLPAAERKGLGKESSNVLLTHIAWVVINVFSDWEINEVFLYIEPSL